MKPSIDAAINEALEEAGLVGRIVGQSIGSFEYSKQNRRMIVFVNVDGGRFYKRQMAGIESAFTSLGFGTGSPTIARPPNAGFGFACGHCEVATSGGRFDWRAAKGA